MSWSYQRFPTAKQSYLLKSGNLMAGTLAMFQNEWKYKTIGCNIMLAFRYLIYLPKGQLISKCPFGVKTSSKKPTKLFLNFCPDFFCSFLGASWKLFELPGDLVSNIINKEAYRKPHNASRKPQGSYKKFQGRNPEIILLVFWKKF